MNAALSRRVSVLRTHVCGVDPRRPRFMETDRYRYGGVEYRRLRVLLRSNGCSVPTCTMCSLPNEGLDRQTVIVSPEDYEAQLRWAMTTHPGCAMVCLYNDGSFFADREFDPSTRLRLVHLVRDAGVRVLMVESLPGFATHARVAEVRRALRSTRLVVGIGLQSSDKFIRESCVRSPVREGEFLECLDMMRSIGVDVKAYLILKPPFLTEDEAIEDCDRSLRWLAPLAVKDITLCPTRVAPGTVLEDLSRLGMYFPVTLSSVVACLRFAPARIEARLRVSLFNVASSDYDAIVPHACDDCRAPFSAVLEAFNRTGSVHELLDSRCAACDAHVRSLETGLFFKSPMSERIGYYLNAAQNSDISRQFVHLRMRET